MNTPMLFWGMEENVCSPLSLFSRFAFGATFGQSRLVSWRCSSLFFGVFVHLVRKIEMSRGSMSVPYSLVSFLGVFLIIFGEAITLWTGWIGAGVSLLISARRSCVRFEEVGVVL